MLFSLILWMPSWGGMVNGFFTLRGAWHRLREDPILKFMVVAVTYYGMATFEGPMMSIKSVNAVSHFTDWTIGHVHAGAQYLRPRVLPVAARDAAWGSPHARRPHGAVYRVDGARAGGRHDGRNAADVLRQDVMVAPAVGGGAHVPVIEFVVSAGFIGLFVLVFG